MNSPDAVLYYTRQQRCRRRWGNIPVLAEEGIAFPWRHFASGNASALGLIGTKDWPGESGSQLSAKSMAYRVRAWRYNQEV